MIRLKKNEHGFTLIELLVVLLVMSVLSLLLANFIADWLQVSSQEETEANLLSTAELAINKVTNDIQLSGSVDATNRWADPNGPGSNQYGWTSSSTVLVLAKVAVNSSGAPIFEDGAGYETLKDDEVYFLSGTTLYRRTLASGQTGDIAVTTCPASDASPTCPADNVVAAGVTNWAVSYYDINGDSVAPSDTSAIRSVQISITLTSGYSNGAVPIRASYTTRMVFRND